MGAINADKIIRDLANGALLIDVRKPEEYSASHALGAINIPLTEIKKGQRPNIPKDTNIYVYCGGGKRAAKAKRILERSGYKNVVSIISLDNWIEMGGEISTS